MLLRSLSSNLDIIRLSSNSSFSSYSFSSSFRSCRRYSYNSNNNPFNNRGDHHDPRPKQRQHYKNQHHVLLVQLKNQLKTALDLTDKQAETSWHLYHVLKQQLDSVCHIEQGEGDELSWWFQATGPEGSKRFLRKLKKLHGRRIKLWKRHKEEKTFIEYWEKRWEILMNGNGDGAVGVLGWEKGRAIVTVKEERMPSFEDVLRELEPWRMRQQRKMYHERQQGLGSKLMKKSKEGGPQKTFSSSGSTRSSSTKSKRKSGLRSLICFC
ncbi:hypothetical protein QBC38DRAFT_494069 [Podospora fimiseda]|uniref:Uncharacterized protein n=1 Tax=Podospora fimiseda TaxID=252190 RepID=A0AAN6YM53_9PEZI|nr:hypothetical protein QBC38DRAFT_494069 [Podospora fimiseda]